MWLITVLLLISLMTVLIGQMIFPELPSFFYQTIILLLMGTTGIYFYLIDVKRQRPEYFVQLYLATLMAKILAYGGYVLFVVWDDPAQASNNALVFMFTYFIFTTVEIIFLYRKVSRQ